MKRIYLNVCMFFMLCLSFNMAIAQTKTIKGSVNDNKGAGLPGTVVSIPDLQYSVSTDDKGNYTLSFDSKGLTEVTVTASLMGFEKEKAIVNIVADNSLQNFTLSADALGLKETVITGVSNPRSKLESSVSISSIRADQMWQSAPRTTAELFRAIPGIRSEASAGDGNTNITVRGVPISSGGSKYLQLQEDGLPVLQFGDIAFGTSDIFLRADQSVSRIEAIRGGSASTQGTNSPAGIINFISKTGTTEGGSVATTLGLDYNNYRTDFDYGAPISKDLSFHIGGFYRLGEGVRTAGYNANNGGQVKASMTKKFNKGYARIYLKYLNDRAAAYMPMPIEVSGSNSNPTYKSMNGFDALTGTIHSPYMLQNNGLGVDGGRRNVDVADGMHPESKAFGAEFVFDLGEGWSVENRGRFSINSGRFIAPFPAQVGSNAEVLKAVGSAMGLSMANANLTYANDGTAYTGQNAMIIHMFDTELKNFNLFANDFKVKKKVNDNLTINGGVYKSYQNISMAWLWNSYLADVNGNGTRPLDIDTFGTKLTQNGQFAYGVPVWGNCCTRSYDTKYDITAPNLGVAYEFKNLSVDASARWDMGKVTGSFAGASQSTIDVNNDGKITANEISVSSINHTSAQVVNYKYDYLSYSVGANYKLNNSTAVFGRYSTGATAKADRILFSSSILTNGDARATLDKINQGELGYKYKFKQGGIFVTGFYANVNEEGGYEATTQKVIQNDYQSFGLELEGVYALNKNFDLRASATVTKAEITSGANKGNAPRRQSPLIYTVFANYKIGKHAVGLNFIGTMAAYTQDDNKLVMPAYTITNAYANFSIAKNLMFSLNANNLLNSLGITESEDASITEGKTNIVRARSIAGRSVSATLRLTF
jgi:outer membrane receptor protein involved in Fe transport